MRAVAGGRNATANIRAGETNVYFVPVSYRL